MSNERRGEARTGQTGHCGGAGIPQQGMCREQPLSPSHDSSLRVHFSLAARSSSYHKSMFSYYNLEEMDTMVVTCHNSYV